MTVVNYSNSQDNGVNFEVNKFGEYQVAYTILGCNTSDTMNVKFAQAIPEVYTEELVRCDLEADMFVDSYGLEMGWTFVSGPSFADFSNPLGEETSVTVSEYGDYTLGRLRIRLLCTTRLVTKARKLRRTRCRQSLSNR